MSEDRVVKAKEALMEALGANSVTYLANMKMWFRCKWTREEFDKNCRKLLPPHETHLHNRFLLAVLNKIDSVMPIAASRPAPTISKDLSISSSLSKKPKRMRLMSDNLTFDRADLMDYLPDENPAMVTQQHDLNNGGTPLQERYSVQELFLPDHGLVMGRLLIDAWELGLTNADDTAAEMIGMGVQILLKNILQMILTNRKNFKTTNGGTYLYDVGAPAKDLSLRNTVTRTKIDDTPVELDKDITSMANMPRAKMSCTDETTLLADCEEMYVPPKRRISKLDLYLTLKDQSIIASHSVYSINMERISNLLENSL